MGRRSPFFLFIPVATVALSVLGSRGSARAGGEEARGGVHPNDGLPPIGDPSGDDHKKDTKACAETYERLSLVLDDVVVDGASKGANVDSFGKAYPITSVRNAQLQVDVVAHQTLDYHLVLVDGAIGPAPMGESFDAR